MEEKDIMHEQANDMVKEPDTEFHRSEFQAWPYSPEGYDVEPCITCWNDWYADTPEYEYFHSIKVLGKNKTKDSVEKLITRMQHMVYKYCEKCTYIRVRVPRFGTIRKTFEKHFYHKFADDGFWHVWLEIKIWRD